MTGGLPLRFLHSSDWQIGKVFRHLPADRAAVLQEARLEAVSALGRLAQSEACRFVLVAGDVYDLETPTERTLRAPLERMRAFPGIDWYLLPGNHDPARAGGLWERLMRAGLPENVHALTTPRTVAAADGLVSILPAPLVRKQSLQDPTEHFDALETPAGVPRIGLAHGALRDFGEGRPTPNRIAADRALRAGLSYLALGDWHGWVAFDERSVYSGAPEPDAFGQENAGCCALVTLRGEAPPLVERRPVGRFGWYERAERLTGPDDIERLERLVRTLAPDPGCALLRLRVEGALSVPARAAWQERVVVAAGSALFHIEVEDALLSGEMTADDLDTFGAGGVLRLTAERLQVMAAPGADPAQAALARAALERLVLEYRLLGGGD